jgi:hypothetical protein
MNLTRSVALMLVAATTEGLQSLMFVRRAAAMPRIISGNNPQITSPFVRMARRIDQDDKEDWRDQSTSGRRLTSKRLEKMRELEEASQETPNSNTQLAVATGVFLGAVLLALVIAFSMGYDGTPRV